MSKRYRPAIPDRVKLQVVLRQDGLCGCGCGGRLGTLANTEFDHCPPLALREYDEATRKYTPDANDPEKIVARIKQHHRDKTSHPKGPHTSHGGDQHLIAKTRHGRDEKFKVLKLGPLPPAMKLQELIDAGEKCRKCGEYAGDCECPAPMRMHFGQRRRA